HSREWTPLRQHADIARADRNMRRELRRHGLVDRLEAARRAAEILPERGKVDAEVAHQHLDGAGAEPVLVTVAVTTASGGHACLDPFDIGGSGCGILHIAIFEPRDRGCPDSDERGTSVGGVALEVPPQGPALGRAGEGVARTSEMVDADRPVAGIAE